MLALLFGSFFFDFLLYNICHYWCCYAVLMLWCIYVFRKNEFWYESCFWFSSVLLLFEGFIIHGRLGITWCYLAPLIIFIHKARFFFHSDMLFGPLLTIGSAIMVDQIAIKLLLQGSGFSLYSPWTIVTICSNILIAIVSLKCFKRLDMRGNRS